MKNSFVIKTITAQDVFIVDEWAQIFKRLANPVDILNVANTDPLFRSILQYPTDNWMSTLFHKAFECLYDHLSCNDILNLRQVSKSWKNTIDQFLESQQRWQDCDEEGVQKVKLNLFQHPQLLRRERYAILLDEMNSNPKAKIVGGSVYIRKTLDENYLPLDFRPFFWKYGHKVYHLSMQIKTPYNGNPVLSWKMVVDLLVHTPNLKTLNLTFVLWGQDEENGPWAWCYKLKKFFQRKTIPALDNLVSLQLKQYGSGFCTSFNTDWPPTQALVKVYGSTLHHLDIRSMFCPIPYPETLKSLKKLVYGVSNLEQLEALKSINAPLESLAMYIYPGRNVSYPMEHLEFLEKFASTLKYLDIHSTFEKEVGSTGSERLLENGLFLPKLQKLILTEYKISRNPSLNFLFNFPKLRCFQYSWQLGNSEKYSWDNENALYIFPYLTESRLVNKAKFYKCPIWEKLPFLETVELEAKIGLEKYGSLCTRKEYENFDFEDYNPENAKNTCVNPEPISVDTENEWR